jgi:hypothetical protein
MLVVLIFLNQQNLVAECKSPGRKRETFSSKSGLKNASF